MLNKNYKYNLKEQKKNYNFSYFINFKLTNIYINKLNLMLLLNNFFILVQLYFNIFYKYLVETLYYYNYLFFFKDYINFKKYSLLNLFQNNELKSKITLDNLYYLSYMNILVLINTNIYIHLNNNFTNIIFIGHHQNFSNIFLYRFQIPITFFYEMDTLYYNIFGNLILGKFIYSPSLKVYENIDILNFLFKKFKNNSKINIGFFIFLNKIKYYFFFFLF